MKRSMSNNSSESFSKKVKPNIEKDVDDRDVIVISDDETVVPDVIVISDDEDCVGIVHSVGQDGEGVVLDNSSSTDSDESESYTPLSRQESIATKSTSIPSSIGSSFSEESIDYGSDEMVYRRGIRKDYRLKRANNIFDRIVRKDPDLKTYHRSLPIDDLMHNVKFVVEDLLKRLSKVTSIDIIPVGTAVDLKFLSNTTCINNRVHFENDYDWNVNDSDSIVDAIQEDDEENPLFMFKMDMVDILRLAGDIPEIKVSSPPTGDIDYEKSKCIFVDLVPNWKNRSVSNKDSLLAPVVINFVIPTLGEKETSVVFFESMFSGIFPKGSIAPTLVEYFCIYSREPLMAFNYEVCKVEKDTVWTEISEFPNDLSREYRVLNTHLKKQMVKDILSMSFLHKKENLLDFNTFKRPFEEITKSRFPPKDLNADINDSSLECNE